MDAMDGLRDAIGWLNEIRDPRVKRTRHHPLTSIVAIAIMAVMSGADEWVEIAEYGREKRLWLETFLDLPHGIASHDTFGRVFAAIDPLQLERCFQRFTQSLSVATGGAVLAIDGKTLRRSFEGAGRRAAIHMVNAWCTASGLALGQLATEDKSNEITAIPQLLALLDLHAMIVTIDAAGCQKKIARQIIKQEGQYILALKDNQKTMHEEVEFFFREAIAGRWEHMPHAYYREVEGDHGRVETRRIWCTGEVDWFQDRQDWAGLTSFICVESCREVMAGKTTTERRYFISSLPAEKAADRLAAVRGHWEVENKLHWRLDVSFAEDACRVRKGHGPENFSRLRRLALNLLVQDKASKVGVKAKRRKAGWSNDYLIGVLTAARTPQAANDQQTATSS